MQPITKSIVLLLSIDLLASYTFYFVLVTCIFFLFVRDNTSLLFPFCPFYFLLVFLLLVSIFVHVVDIY